MKWLSVFSPKGEDVMCLNHRFHSLLKTVLNLWCDLVDLLHTEKGISRITPHIYTLEEPTPRVEQSSQAPCGISFKSGGFFDLGLTSWTVLRSNSWIAERVSQMREIVGVCNGESGVDVASADVIRLLSVVCNTDKSRKGIMGWKNVGAKGAKTSWCQ